MADSREFYVLDMGVMVDSSASLSTRLNTMVERSIPKGRGVHFLQALSHDGHCLRVAQGLRLGPAGRREKEGE